MKPIICIGISAFTSPSEQVVEDYMRLMYHLGRRCQDYNFQLAIKWKSEQFRARNAIVKTALQMNADYLLMLDDDHVFDIGNHTHKAPDLDFKGYEAYDIPIKLVKHLKDNEKIGIVGALYYQRGGTCYPVVMHEKDGLPFFLHHSEISGRMQKVDVTGGGCMMIRMSVFDKIDQPWFEPEHDFGTDIQLAKQVRKAGYEVWCDTSLEIGHLQKELRTISSQNVKEAMDEVETDKSWKFYKPLEDYRKDAEEYLRMSISEMGDLAAQYDTIGVDGDLRQYYASKGREQLARQVLFHHTQPMVNEMQHIHQMIDVSSNSYGCDFGCGSAPVTYEFAKYHQFDFIDIDGAGAYEFLKWRCKKNDLKSGFELKGPYDYIFMLDSLEHIKDWKETLDLIISHIKDGGALITNFFINQDFDNVEHVNMDHDGVQKYLFEHGFVPRAEFVWQKQAQRKTA